MGREHFSCALHDIWRDPTRSITCDQASLFFRGGKERLIQLLDYSSAAPYFKYLSARTSAMPSPDKNEPSKITGSCVVGGNYTRREQCEFTCSAVQYSRQKYGLFCKTRPPVSFIISKFQKQNLVKVPFHFVSQQKTRSSAAVFDVALAVRPFWN